MLKLLPFFAALFVYSQDLSLEKIMRDPIWMGAIPGNAVVDEDRNTVYFQVPRANPEPRAWMKYDLKTRTVSDCKAEDLPHALRGAVYARGDIRILEIAGDLWLQKTGEDPYPLISRAANLKFVRFLGPRDFVYREDGDLHGFSLTTGQSVQLTRWILDEEDEEKETYYTSEEKKLLNYVENLYKREDALDRDRSLKRQLGPLSKPGNLYLGKNYKTPEFGVDGDDRWVLDVSEDRRFASIVLEPEKDGESDDYAEFINKEGEVKIKPTRPRVGHETKTWKLAIADLNEGEVRWLDLYEIPEIDTDRLAEIKESLSEEDRQFLPKEEEGPRPVIFVPGGFQPGGNLFLVTVFSRDYKDKWILALDPTTMDWSLVQHQYDPAWVQYIFRGIGTAGYVSGAAFWRSDGGRIMFISDASGYQHLYEHNLETSQTRALTEGEFEVHHPYEGPDGKSWYFHSTEVHPGELHFYRMPLDGGARTALTSRVGRHVVEMGVGGRLMADLYSRTNHPPVLRVKSGKRAWEVVYDGASEEFRAIAWAEPEVVTYANRDGGQVYARLYRPESPNGAGVIFVHGAGYLQNAHKGWSGYFREYMFHNLLLQEGYTVLDPDYQASAGYGRDWRTAIYRHMGGKDLDDILDGAKYLADQHGIDAERLGVYGGSYGGFIALMAMFTQPDVFQFGAALRPVTDWAYYNHWYTARILNTPAVDPVAYRRSSPIYFAEGLKGRLLMCHGMVDSNVLYQDSVRLAQRLIELQKHGWELSSYPVEPHGFRTPSGWYDEYRRIHELLVETLQAR